MAYHPVVVLPEEYQVLDLSSPPLRPPSSPYTVGRYNEDRAGMYTSALFAGGRTVHMGVDIGGPEGTPVHAFDRGHIFALADNKAEGDYGPTVVTEHVVNGSPMWALHGHLGRSCLERWRSGDQVDRGAVIGHMGTPTVNGGWPPHVHFQLSIHRPKGADMPGVVAPGSRAQALLDYPDPRLVLGRLY